MPEKLFISIYDCLKHRKNAVTEAKHICNTITSKLIREVVDDFIDVNMIRDTSLVCLFRFDTLAAANYSAYHKD